MKLEKAKFNAFIALGVFALVALAGLVGGIFYIWFGAEPTVGQDVPAVTVPTVIEYRTEAGSVLAPFLGQVMELSGGVLSVEASEALADLAKITQERLLRIRVPGAEKAAHLSFVLLLDQWSDTISAGNDTTAVLARTNQLIVEYRWVLPEENL
ncbi:MAG: hypothetical protein V1738_05695 [Patescibacteria group bacterium]